MRKTAVVILNYNGLAYLAENIAALRDQSYHDFELVIADNASGDGSAEFIEKSFPEARLIRFDKNYGFAGGYNRAIEQVKAEYILLLNQDMVLDKNCLAELVKAMEGDPGIAACGSKMIFLDQPNIVNHAGGVIMSIGGGYDLGFGQPDGARFAGRKDVGYVCGAAMMVSRKVFQDIGGFDQDYFMYGEDVDLCWRMWLCGYRVSFIPASVAYHKSAVYNSAYSTDPRKIYLNQRNRLLSTIKNFGRFNALLGLVYNGLASAAKIIKMIFRFEIIQIFWLVRGYLDFLKLLPSALRKRRVIQKKRVVSDRWLFQENLIEKIRDSFLGYKRY